MSVNSMSFEQSAAVLTNLAAQATGETGLVVTDLSSYISVGQKTLRQGYDPLNIGISQMVAKTIFAHRPYKGALSSLDRDSNEWGAITRKVNTIKQDIEDSYVYDLTESQHFPDMFSVRKPRLYQTNFYGFDVWADHVSITRQQLKNAVTSPADMGRLLDLILGSKADEMELARTAFRRATLANMIGAINALNNSAQVRHLVTEYSTAIGRAMTADDYTNFIRWAYSQIAKASDMLEEPNSIYHLNPSDGVILRHTSKENQRLYIYSGALHDVDAQVLAVTFNADKVTSKLPAITERVNFFQSMTTPNAVNVIPAYIGANGAVVSDPAAQNVTNIFALLVDRDALGVNFYDSSVEVSPFEAAGKYYNYWYHDGHRYYNDVTENAILFLMD